MHLAKLREALEDMDMVERDENAFGSQSPSHDPFQDPMRLGIDSFGADQESFDFMFQTMPYEVSEPVMCKSHFENDLLPIGSIQVTLSSFI